MSFLYLSTGASISLSRVSQNLKLVDIRRRVAYLLSYVRLSSHRRAVLLLLAAPGAAGACSVSIAT